MSNQSNYAHETFWENIKGNFKNKKILNKSLMLFLMVGNMASIFTQNVHCKQHTHVQFLSSIAVYSAIYISFPSLSPCEHFHHYFTFAAVTVPVYSGASFPFLDENAVINPIAI